MKQHSFSKHRRSILLSTLVLGSGLVSAQTASTFPDKPITIIVPYVAGTLADTMARTIGNEITKSTKQPVIVDNRPGASEIIGATAVHSSQPNGYTLLITLVPNLIAPSTQARLPYKGLADFSVITKIVSLGGVMAVSPKVPANNAREFLAYVKKNPDKLSFGSSGVGSVMQLSGELLSKMTDSKMVHVPYKSFQQAMTDLVSGQIEVAFPPVGIAAQFAKEGKVRILGSLMQQRYEDYPDIPTLNEQGVNGYESYVAYAAVAAKGTPKPIIDKLNKEINAAVQSEAFKTRMKAIGGVTLAGTLNAEQSTSALISEEKRWNDLVKDLNLQLE